MNKFILKGIGNNSFRINYEASLNKQQLEAVTAGKGPILVIAGAGSGKTRTITYRVAWLLDCGVPPERILLLTFTNKAAKEMLHRVEHLLSGEARKIWGGTFHHIGNLILRRYAHLLGYNNNYTIIDREDSRDLLDLCLTDLNIDIKKRRFPKSDILSDIISLAISTEENVEKIVKGKYPFFSEQIDEIKRVLESYQNRKRKLNLMDFDDLLLNWKKLLIEYPDIKDIYSENFLHILVDEYQDTNKLQSEIIDLMASYHRNIMVVGDDSQSIYSFRGANFANIIDFPKRYPDAKIFKLEINYRSTPHILWLTNCIIAGNKKQFPKKLRAVKKGNFKPVFVPLRSVNQQAEFVAQRILEIRDEGRSLKDIAVLYRSHYHSLELQMELTRRGIPFVVRSGLRFFERAHIKDVTAYLKIILNPRDELSWKRLLKMLPGVGNVTADRIWKDISGSDKPLERVKSKQILDVFSRKIPKEWKVVKLKEIADLVMGQSPPGKTYNEDGKGLPFFQGKTDFSFRYPQKRIYCTAPKRLASAGDTLVSVRAPIGAINMAFEKCSIGRGLAAFRHISGSRSYTYYMMRSLSRLFSNFEAEGTVFGCIKKTDFQMIPCIKPPIELIQKFEEISFPIYQKIEINEKETRILTILRDTLLPKLISGKIRISLEGKT